jgi:LAO/AO transport system kinase
VNIPQLCESIVKGDTTALAKSITLLESQKEEDWALGKELLSQLPVGENQSRRLGFSGPPGVGKSSFIEKLGGHITAGAEKVAVLAIDPSSGRTGGSILGDKTRMEALSRHPLSFVRPSPSRGHLGGVTSSMPGVILLCEAAGYDWILVESVGVGQSEVELVQMVDFFTLIAQPGAGDELQAIKKGILEHVDMIVVNKIDQDNKLATITAQQYLSALKVIGGASVPVKKCSALTGEGMDEIYQFYQSHSYDRGRRNEFLTHWFRSLIQSEFRKRLASHPKWKKEIHQLEETILQQKLLPHQAVDELFQRLGWTNL